MIRVVAVTRQMKISPLADNDTLIAAIMTPGDLEEQVLHLECGHEFRIPLDQTTPVKFECRYCARVPTIEEARERGKTKTYSVHRVDLEWRECWNCGGEGYSSHDCDEDSCCCADPENNVRCDICRGAGSYLACLVCAPEDGY